MTQEANEKGQSKVPFLEDALDSLDEPQTKSSPSSSVLMDDGLDLPDIEQGGEGAFDDDAILLDDTLAEDNQPTDVTLSEDAAQADLPSTDIDLPQAEESSDDLPSLDDMTLPSPSDEADDDIEQFGLPEDEQPESTPELPVDDEDVLDDELDDLGQMLPESPDNDTSVDSQDDSELDLLEAPAKETQPLPVDDEDVLDVGIDDLEQMLPGSSEDDASDAQGGDNAAGSTDALRKEESPLPVDDEDVLDVPLDELDPDFEAPVTQPEAVTPEENSDEEPEIESPGNDELSEIDGGSDDSIPEPDEELPSEDELGLPELDSVPTQDEGVTEDESSPDDDFDLLMGGDDSSDENNEEDITDASDFEFPVSDDEPATSEPEPSGDDLDDGMDLLMGGDDEDDTSPSQPKSNPDDDFDLLMNSDDESSDEEQSDPISDWEKDDEDDLDDDDELLSGFMPDNSGNDIEDEDDQGLDDGVADMLDTFAPTMSKDEDVDDFLEGIEAAPEPEKSKADKDFLTSIATQEDVPDVAPENKATEPKEEPKTSKAEKNEKTENAEKKKPGLIGKISRIFVAVGLVGGLGVGGMYVSQNGLPSDVTSLIPSFSTSSNNAAVNPNVTKEIDALRKKVEALSSEVTQIKSDANSTLAEYQRLVGLQSELSESQSKQLAMITELKSSAKKYEGEMISRLEKLALYVKSVETGGNERQAIMRDSLYKELVAYIKANASNDDAGKLTELAEALRKQSVKTAQIDAALQAQRRVVSIIEDEQDYIRETVETIRDKNTGPNTNLLMPSEPKKRPKKVEVPKVEPKTDEVCCVFVEENKQKAQTATHVKQDKVQAGYRLVSVIKRGPRSWDIFLEPTVGNGRMSVEKYTFTPTGASSVPGYGRITDVVELNGGNARIPYKVITEKGTLVSRKKG